MASSNIDADTEALIAQLMAEDLGESYQAHCAPIGASYHDYEEPLSSYERQCLDAANDPDDVGQGSGWGLEETDGANEAAAPDEGLDSIEPPGEDNWDSRFVDEDGQVQDYTAPGGSPQAVDEDDTHSDSVPCSNSTSEDLAVSQARIICPPTDNVTTNPVGETPKISASTTQPTQPTTDICTEPIPIPCDHLSPSDQDEPSIPSSHLKQQNEPLPSSNGWVVENQWDDGLDYSSSKGKGKAVRAYDEFKRGLRDAERESRDPKVAERNRERNANYDGEDEDEEEEEEEEDDDDEEGEIRDEDLPFVRIPWPHVEKDELLSRREDAAVVEIRVGDEETLESILRDIERRDERRRKGEMVEDRVEEVLVGEDVREGEEGEVLGAKHLAASWR